MSEAGTWPEQNAVNAWLEKHVIKVEFKQAMELKEAVTKYRIEVQTELERAKMRGDILESDLHLAKQSASDRPSDTAIVHDNDTFTWLQCPHCESGVKTIWKDSDRSSDAYSDEALDAFFKTPAGEAYSNRCERLAAERIQAAIKVRAEKRKRTSDHPSKS